MHGAVRSVSYLPDRAICGDYLSLGNTYVDLTDTPERADAMECAHCRETRARVVEAARKVVS